MKRITHFLWPILLTGSLGHAMVDMKSANYTDNWTDMRIPGVGYDLRINRTANTRSLFNGIFGFGMCSDFETTVEVTAEGNLRLTECGAGMEIIYSSRGFNPAKVTKTVKFILDEVKKRRPELKADYLANLEKEIRADDSLRDEFARQLNLKGKIDDGAVYTANSRDAETISIKGGAYRRILADGSAQSFDITTGKLIQMYDKNQNYLKISWDKNILQSVSDNMGRKLTFTFNPTNRKAEKIVGPNGMTATYAYKGEDLVEVKDSSGEVLKYAYDDVHNITRITYADGTYKALTYNKDKDWVTSFRNRKGCIETYEYVQSKEDPLNHFWSNVVKKCGTKTTNVSKYEFVHMPRKDGIGVYLHRVRSDNNKKITEIVYHEVFGKPVSVLRDGIKTEYTYYDTGLVKTKKEPKRSFAYEYKNTCGKVSMVSIQTADDPPKTAKAKTEKITRLITTRFSYDKAKCNLLTADNSEGQAVKLWYDPHGRISQIEDQAKKLVKIKYEAKFGKPSIVTRPGLGTIQVSYKGDGEIEKVESKQGPTVAVQVASIFNSLLDIIAPATNDALL